MPSLLTRRALLLICPILVGLSWQTTWQEGFQQLLTSIWNNGLQDTRCNSSYIERHEINEKGSTFSTSPLDSLVAPRTNSINGTAWEQWYFEGVSASGKEGITVAISRDASYAILGQGNLRVEVDVVWEDGTQFGQVEWMDSSLIENCAGNVRGTWRGPEEREYSFEVAENLKTATVKIKSPAVSGSFFLRSFTPAHYPDGKIFPDASASTQIAPLLHWVEPIPAGYMDATFEVQGRPFAFTGIGAHDHFFAADSWFNTVVGWNIARAVVGPYTLVYWAPESIIHTDTIYPSFFLAENGRKVFATTNNQTSDTEDYAIFKKTYDGSMAGSLADKATGYTLELVSPSAGKQWNFAITHMNVEFEMALDAKKVSGLTGFTNVAEGGEEGGPRYCGVAAAEQVRFPALADLRF